MRSCAVLALSILLSGCDAIVDNIAPRAATYNAETHSAQMTGVLLNVVRASQRHPLEFTAIVNATGGAQANASLGVGVSSVGLTVPFSVDAIRTYSASPNVAYQSNQNFVVQILDSQEFVSGILRPLDMKTIDYYLQQGFPRGVMLYLIIDRIEVVDDNNKVVRTIDNYPGVTQFSEFGDVVDGFIADNLRTETITDVVDLGPSIPASEVRNADLQMRIDQAGILLERDARGDYRLRKRVNSVRFCYEGGEGADRCGATQRERERPRNVAAARNGGPAVEEKSFLLAPKQQQFARYRYRIYPRSTEAIIYYLGEVIRYQNADPTGKSLVRVPVGRIGDSEPLFVLSPTGVVDPLATISYRGTSYSAPASGTRTAQVVNIVRQLISLNRSAKDIPTTNVLTVVGN
ncbi:MAG: hypothetical protein AB7F36_04730 [Reyranellaceae bacterium]